MGYHLTIVRSFERPISESEFATAAATLDELRYDPVVGKADYFREGELRASLMLQDGEIWTKVAAPDVIILMAKLAGGLGARVFGDEGEWYSEDGEAHTDPSAEKERIDSVNRVKRRRLIWNILRFSLLGLVLYLMYRRHTS